MFKKILLGALGLLLIGSVAQAADAVFNITEMTIFGNMRISMGNVTCVSTSYDTLGIALSPAKFGLSEVSFVAFTPNNSAGATRYSIVYDYTNDKFILFDSADGATWGEETDGATVAGVFYWTAFGR